MAVDLEQFQDSTSADLSQRSNSPWIGARLDELIGLVGTMSVAAAARELGITKNMAIGALDRAAKRGEYRKPKDLRLPSRAASIASEPSPGGCRYIADDPAIPGWSWCDRPVHRIDSAWCAEHHALTGGR